MISDEELDRLAGVLCEAYEGEFGDTWPAVKREYPTIAACWRRVAEAALKAIVVAKIGESTP